MILLDSNVVSALMLSRPDFTVVRQLNRFPPDDIWISSAAVMEVRLGLLISPVGRKRAAREAAFELLMGEIIRNRVAPLDIEAAEAAAKLHAERHARGRVVGTRTPRSPASPSPGGRRSARATSGASRMRGRRW